MRVCTHNMLTRLSSKRLLSSSHLSRDAWRSFSSPSREVTWALRASLSLVNYKTKHNNSHQFAQWSERCENRVHTWIYSFSFCLSRASVLSLCIVFCSSRFSFSWSSLYLSNRTSTRHIHPNQHLSFRAPHQMMFFILHNKWTCSKWTHGDSTKGRRYCTCTHTVKHSSPHLPWVAWSCSVSLAKWKLSRHREG